MEEPAAYGKFGLANLLELREECLREFQFCDAYVSIKQRLGRTLFHGCQQLSLLWLFKLFDVFCNEGKMKLHWLFYLIYSWNLIVWMRYEREGFSFFSIGRACRQKTLIFLSSHSKKNRKHNFQKMPSIMLIE
jgi:hypothetical protein